MTPSESKLESAPSTASSAGVRVRVIGESLIDIVAPTSGAHRRYPGGSPMNVAYGLGSLGVATELLTYIADDAAGRSIVDHLVQVGVRIDPASFAAPATSTALARIHDDYSADYEFDIEWVLASPSSRSSADWTHIGSIGAALPPGAEQLEASLTGLRGAGVLSYDPNIRAELMPPHRESFERFERLTSLCDVVKLSDEDAAWLLPNRTVDQVLDHVLTLGPRLAVITKGEGGSRLASQQARIDVAAQRVDVVDTIGAGDSFMAALIATLCRSKFDLAEDELRRLGVIAATAAMITVSRAGAQPPTLAELRSALAQEGAS